MYSWEETTFRLFLVIVFGGLAGLEREKGMDSRMHTHMMVSIGAAWIMMAFLFGLKDVSSNRVAAQVVR